MLDEWRAEVAKVAQRARKRVEAVDVDDPGEWWERGVADGLDMAVASLGDVIHGESTS